MGENYERLKQSHPCFGGQKNRKGRIHLPVSPGCNIECKFCDRKINDYENRPGVTAQILTPEEALEVVGRALEICDGAVPLTVVGIAGPGDTLATDYALETFRLVRARYPELLLCMSTNGLLLQERAEEILEVGVDSLTVTVNAVDPEIQAQINDRIVYHGAIYTGTKGAGILIENQLAGIRAVSEGGVTVKVNTVLVPGINDTHIETVAKAVRDAGASIYNLIPLIPQHAFADRPAPDCAAIETARQAAGAHIDVFRHCQHCRADAIGIPGEQDFAGQVYLKRIAYKDTFSHG
ncbi:MAG: radical SAM protein [Oscillospiraceae bacterium]|nr:radical SAM protein [Oscillospiraceae bacterium]